MQWYIVGVMLIALELVSPLVGVAVSSGFAAVIVGMLNLGSELHQWGVFFALASIFTIVIYKPLKNLLQKTEGYSNITGSEAEAISSTQIRWSGTVMNARGSFTAGDKVIIKYIEGNVAIVEKKND
jgi:membrane protein implicated in regulation of membrane protease activity